MFKLFPVTITPDGKKLPLIHGWAELATTDQSMYQKWSEEYGSRFTNFGIPTGSINGIIGIDFDFKDGKDPVKAAAEKGLHFPLTLSQRTLSGGFHLIYSIPNDVRIGNSVGKIVPGLDTRGDRGYLVMYQLDQTPIAPCPQWIIDYFKRDDREQQGSSFVIEPNLAKAMLEDLCAAVANAPPGESNNTLNASAFAAGRDLIGTGSLPKDYVVNELYQVAKIRGKSDREAHATINSGIEGGLKNPPMIVCPFTESIVQNLVVSTTWCPPKPTRDMFFDWSHLRRPQNFKDWSPCDITLLTADGGVGKTTILANEAICLALGLPFLGFQSERSGKTLYITSEDSAEKVYATFGKVMHDMGLSNEQIDIVVDSILVKKEADMTIVTKAKDGNIYPNYKALEDVMDAVRKHQPALVILDPIDMFWGSEAGLNDMGKNVAKWASIIRDQAGAQVVLVNHMGKLSSSEKDITQFSGRGGSALPSHARVVRTMVKLKDDEYTELTGKVLEDFQYGIKLVVSKFSDYSPILDEPLILCRTGNVIERSTVIANPKSEESTAEDHERMLELLIEYTKKNNPLVEIAAQSLLKLSKDRTRSALTHLQFHPPDGYLIKRVPNPDVSARDKWVYVVTNKDGIEVK